METNDRTVIVNEEDIKEEVVNEPISTEPRAEVKPVDENDSVNYDFGPLNEKYKEALGENILDEGSFTDLITSKGKISEYESQLQSTKDELQSAMEFKRKWETALETLDPEKLSPNKEVLAISELSDKHKGVDVGTISKVRGSDLESMDHLEGLVLAAKINTRTNLSNEAIKSEILRGLGIENDDLNDLTDAERFRIESKFSSERGILEEIKGFNPEISDFNLEAHVTSHKEAKEQARVNLEGHNKQALDILFDDYKETKTTIKDEVGNDIDISYVVDDGFKEKFFDDALKNLTESGVKITKDNAGFIKSQINEAFRTENNNKIIQDVVNQMLSKKSEAAHNELHNDSPTNKTEAPVISNKNTLPLSETLGAFMKQNR